MNKKSRMTCPNCGHQYLGLYFRSKSICPVCRKVLKTDLQIIGIIEVVIGMPILWGVTTLLRTYLNDLTGILSSIILIIPMLLLHIFMVKKFLTIQVVHDQE